MARGDVKSFGYEAIFGLAQAGEEAKEGVDRGLITGGTLEDQKSQVNWLRYGDRNTNFFHTCTLVRRRRNKIEILKDDNGNWVEDDEKLKNIAVEYFSDLFKVDTRTWVFFITGAFPRIEDGVLEEMRR